jgi:hypothetical protein
MSWLLLMSADCVATFPPCLLPYPDGSSRPFGTIAYESITIYSQWAASGGCTATSCDLTYDMAVVRLAANTGLTTGWMGMTPSDTFANVPITTAGYPGDKGGNQMVSLHDRAVAVLDVGALA